MYKSLNTKQAQADYSGRGAAEADTASKTRENQKNLKSMGKQLMSETGADVKSY